VRTLNYLNDSLTAFINPVLVKPSLWKKRRFETIALKKTSLWKKRRFEKPSLWKLSLWKKCRFEKPSLWKLSLWEFLQVAPTHKHIFVGSAATIRTSVSGLRMKQTINLLVLVRTIQQ
jgi:hypothetical protein